MVFLSGQGASEAGDRPFLDALDLKTLKKERLFHCAAGVYERPLGFVGDSRTRIVTERESTTEPINVFMVDLKSGERTRLTDFTAPAPELTALSKELITYRRADGVPLSGTLYSWLSSPRVGVARPRGNDRMGRQIRQEPPSTIC
jgi:dipeptidyl aminopeptidase/acylaminoacyl peptidase